MGATDGLRMAVPSWEMPHPHEAETPLDKAAWSIVYDLFPERVITTPVGTMSWAKEAAWLVRHHIQQMEE